jgi:hypothetical protein
MAFFEPLEAHPVPKPRRRRKGREDLWQRPTLLVPGYVKNDLVLAVSDQRAVVMHGIACYPTGFGFQLQSVNRFQPTIEDESSHGEFPTYYGSRMSETPDRILRFGVEYANGERATSLDPYQFHGRKSGKETGPHLQFGSGGGGGGDYSYEVWVWPLPREGPVTFACAWPAYGIPETTSRLDGKRLRKAAEKAKPIFA